MGDSRRSSEGPGFWFGKMLDENEAVSTGIIER